MKHDSGAAQTLPDSTGQHNSRSVSSQRDPHSTHVASMPPTAQSCGDRRSARPCTVSIILPTYNEAENVRVLVDRLETKLIDIDYEIIIVDDDSHDLTWQVAAELAEHNWRVTSVRRIGERGLSSAVLSGLRLSRGQTLLVMDADLQHDENVIGQIIRPLLDNEADIVIGSREVEGGSYGSFSRWRRVVSWSGKQLAARLLGTQVTDPMSGFFALSRQQFEDTESSINPRGFKILLEFLARSDEPRVQEVGYEFRERVNGSTKMSRSVVGSYVLALLDLVLGRVVSSTFTAYAIVGCIGALLRFSLLLLFGASTVIASALAFEASVLSNYILNNRFTFATHSRSGIRLWTGLALFHIIAFHGLMVQVGIAETLNPDLELVDLPLLAQLLGIGIATCGNFVANRTFTWRHPSQ